MSVYWLLVGVAVASKNTLLFFIADLEPPNNIQIKFNSLRVFC